MAEPWTDAWAEAEASCPQDALVFDTIELQHVTFEIDGSPVALRFVRDVEERSFGIEETATYNPGQTVAFAPSAFQADLPTVGEKQIPECKITVDNVARDLMPYIEAAVTVRSDLTIVLRQYREDDPSEPCYGPVAFILRQVTVTGTRVEGTARLENLVNVKFPRRVYTRSEFPALVSS